MVETAIKKNMKKTLVLGLTILASLFIGSEANAQSLKGTSLGKGINVMAEDSSFFVKIGFRFQTLFVAEQMLDDQSDLETQMLIRRSRLKFDGFVISPRLQYKAELALSNRDVGKPNSQVGNAPSIVLDAVAKWKATKNLEIWFGQTKLPGNRERVVSSSALQFVDRSIVNGEYNIDRDLGVQFHYTIKAGNAIIKPIASVSMGEGRNVTIKNQGGYDYTGRVEFLPFGKFKSKGDYVSGDLAREETPKLSLGVGYDYNDDAVREQGQLGSFIDGERDLSMIFADMMFKYRGVSVLAEFMDKTTTNPIVSDTAGNELGTFITGMGLSAQAGYLFKNNFEIAARYSTIVPEEKVSPNTVNQYTLGVSKYLKGHAVKLQSDVSLTEVEDTEDPELMFRLQMEVSF